MTNTFRHARLAALALGACLTVGACSDGVDDDASTVDTAGGAVASAPVVSGAGTGSMEAVDEPRNDGEMMTLISHANGAEISSSRLAVENASNADVKAFAREMITDHTAMQKKGEALAKALGVEDAAASGDRMDEMNDDLDELKDKKGADFDKAYMDLQVRAHERTLAELRSFEPRAERADLKSHIGEAIPKVEAHLQKAQQLRRQLGG
jgi:putative membrane protein